jgi:phosphotransferase system HPr-like phosphotransfer protein
MKAGCMTETKRIRQEIQIANEADVWLIKGDQRFSATSIVEVLTADLCRGDKAIIQADGPDAEQAVARLVELVRGFKDYT